MGKPRIIGMQKPYIPNARIKRSKPFGKKGKGKK